jgi:hypothetical protein
MTSLYTVFTGEFLDQAAGITIDRPDPNTSNADILGRIGSIVTLPGPTRYRIIDALPGQSWLAEKL